MTWYSSVDGEIERHATQLSAGWRLYAWRDSGKAPALYRRDPREHPGEPDVPPARPPRAARRMGRRDR